MVPAKGAKAFGERVRTARTQKEISLRKFAAMVGMSPTYLSKVERGEFNPPSEEKVRAIAKVLELDADELLSLGGRVASDLSQIIQRNPREMATFLRHANGLPKEELQRLVEKATQKEE